MKSISYREWMIALAETGMQGVAECEREARTSMKRHETVEEQSPG
jgi:hypothetical protein